MIQWHESLACVFFALLYEICECFSFVLTCVTNSSSRANRWLEYETSDTPHADPNAYAAQ